jgi:ceramide glucosyltransferase
MPPKVSVILPCRGAEPGLAENLRSILAQAYPDFEVLLVTTADDDSLPLLRSLAAEHSGRIRVVLAGRATTSAQKLANQLAAVEAASPESEVLAFVDSDGRPGPRFLGGLVRPLDEPGVGMTTGYRWYLPEDGRFWSYVRSAWDAAALPFLVSNRHNIAFGGAMAVRREVFARAGVAGIWRRALSDDLTMARAVKGLGLRVHFVPACIAVSRDGGTFRQILEWTNRQTTISRVYMPEFWRFTALAHTASILLFVATLALGAWKLGGWGVLVTAGLYLSLLEANVLLMLRTVGGILSPEPAARLRRDGWRYLLAAPVATWLYGANLLRSTLTRRIVWRGIAYEMVSPTETRILNGRPAAAGRRVRVLPLPPKNRVAHPRMAAAGGRR